MKKILFWNVDTQKDFINKDGALYVKGAEEIKPNLKRLTSMAVNYNIPVVNTMDWHEVTDEELSEEPDFVNTFPKHCMAGTKGAELIKETTPIHGKNTIIKKNRFDVFDNDDGYVTDVLAKINPDIVVVYGVATNVCVNFAVLGLAKRGLKVIVVKDAIKELPNLSVEKIYSEWETLEVTFVTTDTVELLMKVD